MPTPDYLAAIGQFVWKFSLLEWDAIYLIVKLNGDDWANAQLKGTSGEILKALNASIDSAHSRLPTDYVARLRTFSEHYGCDIVERNGLIHAHPYSAGDGAQQLGGEDRKLVLREWTLHKLVAADATFSQHQKEGNALVHEYARRASEGK